MKPKAVSQTNKFDKLKPTRLMEDKIGKTQIYNIRNERGNIIKDSEVMKRIRKYHKQFYSDKFDNLDKNPQEKLNKEQIGNLTEKEFREMIVKMIQDLRKRMEAQTEKLQETFNKELEVLKNKQR